MDGWPFFLLCVLHFLLGGPQKLDFPKTMGAEKKIQNDFWFNQGPWELPVAKPTSRRPIFTPNERCFFWGGQTEPQIRTLCESGFISIFLRKKSRLFCFWLNLNTTSFHFWYVHFKNPFSSALLVFLFPTPKKTHCPFFAPFFSKRKFWWRQTAKNQCAGIDQSAKQRMGCAQEARGCSSENLNKMSFSAVFGEFILLCKNKNEQKWQFYMYIFVYM